MRLRALKADVAHPDAPPPAPAPVKLAAVPVPPAEKAALPVLAVLAHVAALPASSSAGRTS